MTERKYYAHFIDAAFSKDYKAPSYIRIGKRQEEFNWEYNQDVEVNDNILGEQSVILKGAKVQASVSPWYYEDNEDELSVKLFDLFNSRASGDACKTSVVDIMLIPDPDDPLKNPPTVGWAWREDAYVQIESVGGDTSGIQTPFNIILSGNRVEGSWDIATRTFTPKEDQTSTIREQSLSD